MNRFTNVDFIRGVAVFVMVLANTIPYFIDLKESVTLRLLFSLPAPIFLIITGYISKLSIIKRGINKKKLFQRALQILFIGVFIDIVFWRCIPFVNFDILYLIAVSQILLIFTNLKKHFLIMLFFLLANILFHNFFEYRFFIADLPLSAHLSYKEITIINPMKRMFFDGWFPLFPWVGFVFLGSFIYYFKDLYKKHSFSLICFGSISLAFLAYIFTGKSYTVRDIYLELFYPAAGLVLFLPLSIYILILGFLGIENIQDNFVSNFFITIGKNSLFVYIFNAFIIAFSISFLHSNHYKIAYLLGIIILIFSTTLLMNNFRKTKYWESFPRVFKFLLGYQ